LKPLLDTHILLWWLRRDPRLPDSYLEVIESSNAENPLWLSEITLWEVATLHSLGRIELRLPLREWLEKATAPPLVRRVGISPAIAAEVAALPESFHRDPADRIIVATAWVLGATLLTCDRAILEADIVQVLEVATPQETQSTRR
jgi:PIN domain nuclease of toxin-antitoxin system